MLVTKKKDQTCAEKGNAGKKKIGPGLGQYPGIVYISRPLFTIFDQEPRLEPPRTTTEQGLKAAVLTLVLDDF